ncbi:MAG: hypothetical protein COX19_16885 [Desulfobacterales bacterium CG23_combo_of_CG06-09_8_20_14_all_51_8]|nr:MAG: hypothetical protein COX19_16885 [Desulfobacterales bacterium CG23_combo_of_CG06-09_8_20_14_all_51_8]
MINDSIKRKLNRYSMDIGCCRAVFLSQEALLMSVKLLEDKFPGKFRVGQIRDTQAFKYVLKLRNFCNFFRKMPQPGVDCNAVFSYFGLTFVS